MERVKNHYAEDYAKALEEYHVNTKKVLDKYHKDKIAIENMIRKHHLTNMHKALKKAKKKGVAHGRPFAAKYCKKKYGYTVQFCRSLWYELDER